LFIFNSLFIPKKDQCGRCKIAEKQEAALNLLGDEERTYLLHLIEKEIIRIEKAEDIERARKDKRYMVIEADMMANVLTPQNKVGMFHYVTKLCNSNLTGYIHHFNRGCCILWHQGLAGKDGNTMAVAQSKLIDWALEVRKSKLLFYIYN